jgi:hypothetical protein
MRTNTQVAVAASVRRVPLPKVHPVHNNEQLLSELLAEAHARIRALEEALDRVKKAV